MNELRKVILILGMHRSGTSFFAGYLDHIGIYGGQDLMQSAFDNPYGFFENNKIVSLNNKILEQLGASWENPIIEESKLHSKYIEEILHTELHDIFNTEFKGEKITYIKDPRISLLFPLWYKVLTRLNIIPYILLPLRDPGQVYSSLNQRNKTPRNKSMLLYSEYIYQAEKNTRHTTRLLVNYESLDKTPSITIDKLNVFISKHIAPIYSTKTNIENVFKKSNKKYDLTESTLEIPIEKIAYEIYSSLSALSDDSTSLKELVQVYEQYRIYRSQIIGLYPSLHVATIVLFDNKGPKPKRTFTQVLSNGSNKIKLEVEGKESGKKLVFYPSSTSAILRIKNVIINNSSEMFSTSVEMIDNLFYLTHGYCSFEYTSKSDIEKIEIEFDVNSLNDNVWSLYESKVLRINIENKKTEIEELKDRMEKEKESHLKEIELLQLLSETEENEMKETLYLKIKKLEESIDKITTQNEDLISQNHRLNSTNYQQSSQLKEMEQELISKKDLVHDLREDFSRLENDLEVTKQELSGSKKIISSQHHEISEFKIHYADRERELNETIESLSYKIGRFVTWPLRSLYELASGSKSFVHILGALFIPILTSPLKLVKSLSASNLVTLFKALKHEHPAQIVRNIRKKLELPSSLSNLTHTVEGQAIGSIKKKSILYISPNLPDFDSSSGGRRATKMISLLSKTCNVFVFTLGARPEKYRKKIEEQGGIVIDSHEHRAVFEQVDFLDTIIFAWFYTLHDNAELLRYYNNVQVIVDSVDVHWVREERSIGQVEGLTVESVQANKKIEIEAYSHADVIWVVTNEDKKAILSELPNSNVTIVSNIHTIENDEYTEVSEPDLLFLGSYNHPPNLTAAKILAKQIMPELRTKVPKARLILAGAYSTPEIEAYGDEEGVDFLGFIPEKQLNDLYASSLICIAPLTAGAGIKGKICEAISHSIPVMTTDIGNEGINLVHEEDAFILPPEEMVNSLVDIIDGKYPLREITSNAKRKLMNIVGPDIAQTRMEESIFHHVSICIVTWNNLSFLERCITSILDHTNYSDYSILIYSNGCTDGTREYINELTKEHENIIPFLSETNDVFVLPNNTMMSHFSQSDVVMLNNDTYVTPGWLTSLREAAYSSPDIGIAGSKVLYPDGRLQEFGSELYENGTGRNIGKYDKPNKKEYQQLMRVGYVSGCSMYIKRKTIYQIGLLDVQFHPCYCEDSDYSYTAWKNNIQTVVTPHSIIYHEEGGTSGTDEESGFKSYQKINFQKFLNKHQDDLSNIQNRINKLNNLG